MEAIFIMANNFRTRIKNKSKNKVSISLFGDFDGASAYELADVVKEKIENTKHIDIHTDGLKNIYHFGLNVFIAHIKKLRHPSINIEFKGRYKENFTN
jgi:anti-anti-sigma regulatory factor